MVWASRARKPKSAESRDGAIIAAIISDLSADMWRGRLAAAGQQESRVST
jgi:hypothetical protein